MIMDFSDWLYAQLNNRGWSQGDLWRKSKASGYKISRPQITHILNGDRQAGVDACIAIAHALGMPREVVFKERGWLLKEPKSPIQPEMTPEMAQVVRELLSFPDPLQSVVVGAVQAQLKSFRSFQRISSQDPLPADTSHAID